MVVKDDIKWEIDGKYDVVLLSAPFLYPTVTTAAYLPLGNL